MTELLEELDQKRQFNNNEAEKHKRLRDELNDKTKEWVQKRDELNSKVRGLVEEAAKRRETRDSLNVQVREAKEKRDLWNHKVNELNEKVASLKKANVPREQGPPIGKLKKELKSLARAGYDVSYIVANDKPEVKDDVRLIPLPIPRNRSLRTCAPSALMMACSARKIA